MKCPGLKKKKGVDVCKLGEKCYLLRKATRENKDLECLNLSEDECKVVERQIR